MFVAYFFLLPARRVWHSAVYATATWLAGWVAGRHTVLSQNC